MRAAQPRPDHEPVAAPAALQLLASFAIRRLDRPVRVSRQERRLVAYLALERRPVARTRLTTMLWPDADQVRAAGNLRSAIWRLRRIDPEIVAAEDDELALASSVTADLPEAERLARQIVDGTIDRVGPGVVPALAHDLLPDWDEPWVEIERERFRQLRLHALESLGSRLIAEGRFGEGVEAGLLTVQADPLRETGHRLLIKVHLAEGNREHALRQYREIERTLRAELDVAPAPETAELVRGLL